MCLKEILVSLGPLVCEGCIPAQIRRRRRGPGTSISHILVAIFFLSFLLLFFVITTINVLLNYYYLLY